MRRKDWEREVECSGCGSILTVTKEDKIKSSHVIREGQVICFISCPDCDDKIDLGYLPKAIIQTARR